MDLLAGSSGSSIETISAPAEARAVVIAAPRPPVPPVTIAVLPAREKSLETSTMGVASTMMRDWVRWQVLRLLVALQGAAEIPVVSLRLVYWNDLESG